MKISAISTNSSSITLNSSKKCNPINSYGRRNPISNGVLKIPSFLKIPTSNSPIRPSGLRTVCFNSRGGNRVNGVFIEEEEGFSSQLKVEVGNSKFLGLIPSLKLSLGDQATFLLTFIACTSSVAFISLVAAAVPTIYAVARAATSLSKLADTAREEIPSTMAAIRLSGMEISDLTLELSDLSQEITDGVTKSTQAVQAAEAGIRQIGSLARQRTMSMIEERANLPVISLQPAVVGAAKKTSQAVGRATKSVMYFLSRGERIPDDVNNDSDSAGV